MMATAAIGHNHPPDPFEAFSLHADDLYDQATQFLDGEGVKTQEQADDVSRLLNMVRKATKDSDEARKVEKRPHDEAVDAVQAKWVPLLKRLDLIAGTAKGALRPYLEAKEAERRAEAQAAALAAREQAEAARLAAEAVKPDDLAGQTTVRVLRENAAAAERQATRIGKQKIHAKGGERAVGLRSVWTPELTDPVAALRHYRERRPDDLKAWLVEQARADVRAGQRSIPGFEIKEGSVAQ